MDYDIDKIIRFYYTTSLKNNLEMLNICNSEDIYIITSYFHKDMNFKVYDSLLDSTLTKNIDYMTKSDLKKKIKLFLSDDVFVSIDKTDFIPPEPVLCSETLTVNIMKSFFKKALYKTVLVLIQNMISNINFYQQSIDSNMFYSAYFELKRSLNSYHDIFLSFYIGLINKYDSNADYIFPIYDKTSGNIYFSKVIYPKAGSGETGDTIKIKEQLDNLFNKNIKQTYDKEEIKQLENLLENKKINKLIARKELKLAPGFNNIIKDVLKEDATDEERKKYFNELFEVQDNKNLSKEELYDIYKNEPNKEGFIKYIVDKTLFQNIPNYQTDNTAKVVSLVDNIFNKILKEDYDYNSLNLKSEDIKFILMLETLNSIKTSSIGSNSNITVNLYKDVDKATINKEEIKFN
jgi:hypothetical protein